MVSTLLANFMQHTYCPAPLQPLPLSAIHIPQPSLTALIYFSALFSLRKHFKCRVVDTFGNAYCKCFYKFYDSMAAIVVCEEERETKREREGERRLFDI